MICLRRFVIPILLLLWASSETNLFGFQPDEFSRKYSGIKVKIVTPITIPIGRDIPVQITLSNTNNATARVLPLDKARLLFAADVTLPNLASFFKPNLGVTGGDLSTRQYAGLIETVRTPIMPIDLPAGKQLNRNLTLGEIVEGRYLRPGKYRLQDLRDKDLKSRDLRDKDLRGSEGQRPQIPNPCRKALNKNN